MPKSCSIICPPIFSSPSNNSWFSRLGQRVNLGEEDLGDQQHRWAFHRRCSSFLTTDSSRTSSLGRSFWWDNDCICICICVFFCICICFFLLYLYLCFICIFIYISTHAWGGVSSEITTPCYLSALLLHRRRRSTWLKNRKFKFEVFALNRHCKEKRLKSHLSKCHIEGKT